MNLTSLTLSDFGPFPRYHIDFNVSGNVCLLLTGRNNEGKSNIILALQLLHAATRVIGAKRYSMSIADETHYRLRQQDVGDLKVGRLVYNYRNVTATVTAQFADGLEIRVYVDPEADEIYADSHGKLPPRPEELFGFMPPLGPLAEIEDRLTEKHVRASINTSLAPRHLRNQLDQILTRPEFGLVQDLVEESWEGVELLRVEYDLRLNQYMCFYREGRYEREIAWAGQGLQVWFQILTHMVRLRETEVLVLDEPEVNLHAEKQHDLIRLLREHHSGTVLIATHSVELMNDVEVSHIIHVQKSASAPTIKDTGDRRYLERVRARVGSSFNLFASQFEAVDHVVLTEDRSDFKIMRGLLKDRGANVELFNIPLGGFSEYAKAPYFREAYSLLMGRDDIDFVMVLDRDYYPSEYLEGVVSDMARHDIRVVYTPGKEIENIFVIPAVSARVIGDLPSDEWDAVWKQLFDDLYLDSLGSYAKLYADFAGAHLDQKSITTRTKPAFDAIWTEEETRHRVIPGKKALAALRRFCQDRRGSAPSTLELRHAVMQERPEEVTDFLDAIVGSMDDENQGS